jgi:hypothetical protein
MTDQAPDKKMIVTQLEVDKLLPAITESLGGTIRVPLSYFKQDFVNKQVSVDFVAETDEIVIELVDNTPTDNVGSFSTNEEAKLENN